MTSPYTPTPTLPYTLAGPPYNLIPPSPARTPRTPHNYHPHSPFYTSTPSGPVEHLEPLKPVRGFTPSRKFQSPFSFRAPRFPISKPYYPRSAARYHSRRRSGVMPPRRHSEHQAITHTGVDSWYVIEREALGEIEREWKLAARGLGDDARMSLEGARCLAVTDPCQGLHPDILLSAVVNDTSRPPRQPRPRPRPPALHQSRTSPRRRSVSFSRDNQIIPPEPIPRSPSPSPGHPVMPIPIPPPAATAPPSHPPPRGAHDRQQDSLDVSRRRMIDRPRPAKPPRRSPQQYSSPSASPSRADHPPTPPTPGYETIPRERLREMLIPGYTPLIPSTKTPPPPPKKQSTTYDAIPRDRLRDMLLPTHTPPKPPTPTPKSYQPTPTTPDSRYDTIPQDQLREMLLPTYSKRTTPSYSSQSTPASHAYPSPTPSPSPLSQPPPRPSYYPRLSDTRPLPRAQTPPSPPYRPLPPPRASLPSTSILYHNSPPSTPSPTSSIIEIPQTVPLRITKTKTRTRTTSVTQTQTHTRTSTPAIYPYPPYTFTHNVDSPEPHIEGWRSTTEMVEVDLDVSLSDGRMRDMVRRDSVAERGVDDGMNERLRLLARISAGLDQLDKY